MCFRTSKDQISPACSSLLLRCSCKLDSCPANKTSSAWLSSTWLGVACNSSIIEGISSLSNVKWRWQSVVLARGEVSWRETMNHAEHDGSRDFKPSRAVWLLILLTLFGDQTEMSVFALQGPKVVKIVLVRCCSRWTIIGPCFEIYVNIRNSGAVMESMWCVNVEEDEMSMSVPEHHWSSGFRSEIKHFNPILWCLTRN